MSRYSVRAEMIVWIVENGEPVKWERLGECNGCGECCQGHKIEFQYEMASAGAKGQEEVYDYSEKEGWSALKAHGVWWWFLIAEIEDSEEKCQCLKDGKCSVWMDEEEFPPMCRYFPLHPKDLEHFQKCGFGFRRAE